MRRRAFIAGVGTAVIWPLVARAQQGNKATLIGVLMNVSEDDPSAKQFISAFRHQLQDLGWTERENARIVVFWAGVPARYKENSTQLAALAPTVVLAATTPAVIAMRDVSPTVPVIFVEAIDPVGSGLVVSLARPGGNVTGFTVYEYAIAAKWLELLKEVVPSISRTVVVRDPSVAAGIGQFAAIQAVAPQGIELSVMGPQEMASFDRKIEALAREGSSGIIVTASQFAATHANVIVEAARRYKLPLGAPFRYFTDAGGLISYGPDLVEPFRRAAQYIDRILRGENPSNLPVQAPTKYELVVNNRTAKASGETCPQLCSPAPTRSSNEKARVYRRARQCGGVAAGGAGAAVP